VAISETIFVDDKLRDMIQRRASLSEIKAHATDLGMENLRYDALMKCVQGVSTLEEALRVTEEDA